MAAIERRRRSNSPESHYIRRQSVPMTARSTDTFANDVQGSERVSPTSPFRLDQRSPEQTRLKLSTLLAKEPDEGTTVLRGSRYVSGRIESGFALPVSTASPIEPADDGGKVSPCAHQCKMALLSHTLSQSLIEEFQNRWSLSSADREHRSDSDSAGMTRTDFMRRDSADSQGMRARRMGRVFSIDSDSGRSDLVTPRGSVSHQGGTAISSVYSTAGTLLEAYPHATRPSLSVMPEDQEVRNFVVAKARPMSSESQDSKASKGSSGREYGTPLTEFPPGFVQSSSGRVAYTPDTDTGTPFYGGSLPPTPVSEEYKGSVSSLNLSTDSGSATRSNGAAEISEEARTAHKREKTVSELIETERSYLQDMLLTRDVWLARARGAEMAEIMEVLRSPFWSQTRAAANFRRGSVRTTRLDDSSGPASSKSSARPSIDRSKSGDVLQISSGGMSRADSQTSHKSLKGFSNPFGTTERAPSSASRLTQSAGPAHGSESRRPESIASSLRLGSGRLRASIASAVAIPDRSASLNVGTSLLAPMSTTDIKTVFGNLEDIVIFSQDFLSQLEDCHRESDDYGQKFLNSVCCFLTSLHSTDTALSSYRNLIASIPFTAPNSTLLSRGSMRSVRRSGNTTQTVKNSHKA